MIQTFQCPICGTLNAIGEPLCVKCGQNFIYNCPVCGYRINNQYCNCPSCNTVFNWGRPVQQVVEMTYSAPAEAETPASEPEPKPLQRRLEAPPKPERRQSFTSRPMFWAMLIVACVLLIGIILLFDRLMNA
jgi:hypothetical protein